MNFGVLENQSESWKSPGNLFLKKNMDPVVSPQHFAHCDGAYHCQ